jgi:hypothetical protein
MAAPVGPDAVIQARIDLRAKRTTLIDAIDGEALAQRTLENLLRTEPEDPDDPENPVTAAREFLNVRIKDLADAGAAERTSRAALATAIATWLKDGGNLVTPAVDVQRLLPSQAIVMFPARLETRFGTTPTASLRVRVYPDELSLDTHEGALTLEEKEAGHSYYEGRQVTDMVEERKRWQKLAGRFGAPRAAYIARVLRPVMQQDSSYPAYSSWSHNWTSEPLTPPLQFPDLPNRPDVWTRPGEAVLPDRWVLVGYRGGKQVFSKAGNPIPEPLPLTLDPGGGRTITDDGFLIDPDLLWSVEYGTAEQIGMAITVTTTDDPGVAQGYERLVLLGVKSSLMPFVEDASDVPPGAPPPDTAMYFERLFDSHHYTRGLAVVPQGTATNNTAGNPTSFPPEDPFGDNSFDFERNPPPFHRTISYHFPTDQADIDPLARALGVPNGVFANVFGTRELAIVGENGPQLVAGAHEQKRASLMNAALWPTTWGYFLEQMMRPIFDNKLDTINEVARSYFRDHVRGRGPSPAFRVGGVPYGVLPAVSLDLWRRQGSGSEDIFEDALVPKLRVLREIWKAAVEASASRIAPPGIGDPWKPLVDVLAQEASSRQIRVRNSIGTDTIVNLGSFLGLAVGAILAVLNQNAQSVTALVKEPGWIKARVLGLKIDATSDVFPDALVTGKDIPLPSNYIRALADADLDALRDDTVVLEPGRSLLCLLIRHALLTEYARLARREAFWFAFEIEFLGMGNPKEEKTFFEKIKDQFPMLKSKAQPYRNDLLALADALTFVTTDEVERVFTETLDLASHRLDAWVTAVATRRLMAMRQSQELARVKPVGTYLGGYAWAENVRPAAPGAVKNGGYIHAPSMPQAAAAALLRSGHQSGGLEAAEKYAVDLSSERVRIGRRLLDEIREGQPLGAVLGYRFERALRDKHTDIPARETCIIALRRLFPLVANKSETDVNAPTDKIAARNVVDGLVLRTKRNAIPFGTGDLPNPNGTPAEKAAVGAILAEVDALDQLADAVADLVTAESVYQIVRGNVAGAGATLDALARGLRPPDPEIARSPRGGTGVTQRIVLAFTPRPAEPTLDEPPGWSDPPTRIPERIGRARNLDRFLGTVLGDVSAVKAMVRHRIGTGPTDSTDVFLGKAPPGSKSLGLRPLDLVALARAATKENEGSLLDRRVLDAVIGGLSNVTEATVIYDATPGVFTFPQAMEVARAIGSAFAGMRPLLADDLVPPAEASTARQGGATDDAKALLDSAKQARTALGSAKDALDAAVAEPAGASKTAKLRAELKKVSTYDPAAFPDPSATAAEIDAAADAASDGLGRRSAAAAVLYSPGTGSGDLVRAAVAGFQAMFGRDFLTTQNLIPRNASELALSLADRDALLQAGDETAPVEMLEQAARVREPLGRVRRVALYAGALGSPQPRIAVVQVPFVKGEGWAGPRPSSTKPPPGGRVSCLLLVPNGNTLDPNRALEGLVLDEWVETVPTETEETGVSFHFDNPGAEAPQTVLAAVPAAADGKWTFAQLLATVNETLDLARVRMLEPEDLPRGLGQALPAIYVTRHSEKAVPSTEFPNMAKDPKVVA